MKNIGIFLIIMMTVSCNVSTNKLKVGVLIPYTDGSRWVKESEYIKKRVEELGGETIIKSAESNEGRQFSQALEMIEQGAKVLVVASVNVNTSAAIVRKAHEKGVKVIAYDRLIRNSELDFYISFDGEKVGQLLAEYTLKNVPGGNFVLMNGDRGDQNAVLFYNGTMKVLQPFIDNKKINIVYTGYMDNWYWENAEHIANKILEFSNTKIDAFVSQYDGLSFGIVSALKKRGLADGAFITGQDAMLDACNRIMIGEQSMTIYKAPKKLAYRCAELASELIENNVPDNIVGTYNGRIDVPTILLAPVVVDKNNLEETVVKDGVLTMDEIMGYKESR